MRHGGGGNDGTVGSVEKAKKNPLSAPFPQSLGNLAYRRDSHIPAPRLLASTMLSYRRQLTFNPGQSVNHVPGLKCQPYPRPHIQPSVEGGTLEIGHLASWADVWCPALRASSDCYHDVGARVFGHPSPALPASRSTGLGRPPKAGLPQQASLPGTRVCGGPTIYS
jgi:hypothetical protein